MATPTGFTQSTSGYFYRTTDGSGPYTVDSDGNPWLLGRETSMALDAGGFSQVVANSAVSAMSTVINSTSIIVTPTQNVFIRQGAAPVATGDGTDLFLLGGFSYRLRMTSGLRLAVLGATAGNVYITPGV